VLKAEVEFIDENGGGAGSACGSPGDRIKHEIAAPAIAPAAEHSRMIRIGVYGPVILRLL
jgi:hypothetical protein